MHVIQCRQWQSWDITNKLQCCLNVLPNGLKTITNRIDPSWLTLSKETYKQKCKKSLLQHPWRCTSYVMLIMHLMNYLYLPVRLSFWPFKILRIVFIFCVTCLVHKQLQYNTFYWYGIAKLLQVNFKTRNTTHATSTLRNYINIAISNCSVILRIRLNKKWRLKLTHTWGHHPW